MKKFAFLLAPLALMFASADAKITNFDVNLSGSSDITLSWTALDQTEIDKGYEGYAVQWSDNLSNLNTEDPMRQWVGTSTSNMSIVRIGIDPNIPHFFRVYAYFTDANGDKVYTHGSDIIDFKWQTDNTSIKSTIARNELAIDPSIVVAETTDNGMAEAYTFPRMTMKKYDTFVIIGYSRPFDVPKIYLDGYMIDIAKDAGFTDIIMTGVANGPNLTSMRFNGLEPNTKYYVRGQFFQSKNGEKMRFGTISPENVTTNQPMTEAHKRKLDLLRRQGKLSLVADVDVWPEGMGPTSGGISSDRATEAESYTTYTVDDTLLNSSNEAAIEAEILQLQKQIQVLRRRLVQIRAGNRNANNTITDRKRRELTRVQPYSAEADEDGLVERRTPRSFERWAQYRNTDSE